MLFLHSGYSNEEQVTWSV